MEEGDTRYRPAVWLQYQFLDQWSGTLHSWGREQAPVLQEQYLLTVARNFPLFKSKILMGNLGLVFAYDRNRISRPADGSLRSVETNKNLGLHFGLTVQSSTRLFAELNWGGKLFPAGYGALYLATARKQDLSLGLGWTL